MDNYDHDRHPRRRIDFDDDPVKGPADPRRRGLRDEDWEDDEYTTPRGHRGMTDDDLYGRRPSRRLAPVRDRYDDDRYSDDRYDDRRYDDDRYDDRPRRGKKPYYDMDNYDNEENTRPRGFIRRHPVLMNVIYICLASVLLGWLAMVFLDFWTFHGEERVVPDAKNVALYSACNSIEHAGLNPVVTDSIYDSYARPGTVVEQTPIPGARIKKGGTVYLTIVAFSPKMITVPDFYNISVRQARALFEGLGIKEVREEQVLSEYEGLVLGARFNGVTLRPGARIPVSAVVTLEVGTGLEGLDENGAPIDSAAIEKVVDAVETLDIE